MSAQPWSAVQFLKAESPNWAACTWHPSMRWGALLFSWVCSHCFPLTGASWLLHATQCSQKHWWCLHLSFPAMLSYAGPITQWISNPHVFVGLCGHGSFLLQAISLFAYTAQGMSAFFQLLMLSSYFASLHLCHVSPSWPLMLVVWCADLLRVYTFAFASSILIFSAKWTSTSSASSYTSLLLLLPKHAFLIPLLSSYLQCASRFHVWMPLATHLSMASGFWVSCWFLILLLSLSSVHIPWLVCHLYSAWFPYEVLCHIHHQPMTAPMLQMAWWGFLSHW